MKKWTFYFSELAISFCVGLLFFYLGFEKLILWKIILFAALYMIIDFNIFLHWHKKR